MELYLTVEQAAEQIQLKPATVREHLRTGQLRGIKRGRSWRVPESALSEVPTKITSAYAEASVATADNFQLAHQLWERLGNPTTHNAAILEIAKAPAKVREIIDAKSEIVAQAYYATEDGQDELADWRALDSEPFRDTLAEDEAEESPTHG